MSLAMGNISLQETRAFNNAFAGRIYLEKVLPQKHSNQWGRSNMAGFSINLTCPFKLKKRIKTDRLILRPWKEEDVEPFAAMNADRRVMEYFPDVKSREESFSEYQRIQEHFNEHRWGFWAVSLIG